MRRMSLFLSSARSASATAGAGRWRASRRRKQGRRVADLRRRPRQHTVLAARPDHQGQLQQARGRVAVQDRRARPAPGIQLQATPLMVERRRLLHRRHAPRGRRARRRAPARCCGCTARTKASAAKRRRASSRAAASPTGPSGAASERIVYVTPGYQMVALDAKTGDPVAELRQRTASSISRRRTISRSIRSPARSACTRRRSSRRT